MNDITQNFNKIDVVNSLINQSIRMFFHREDVISIHLLVSAANEILTTLMKKQGLTSFLGCNSVLIKEEHRKEWIKARRKIYNFSKHADRDIGETVTFNSRLNWLLIFENIHFMKLLNLPFSKEIIFFLLWLWTTQKRIFKENIKAQEFIASQNIFEKDFFDVFDFVIENENIDLTPFQDIIDLTSC